MCEQTQEKGGGHAMALTNPLPERDGREASGGGGGGGSGDERLTQYDLPVVRRDEREEREDGLAADACGAAETAEPLDISEMRTAILVRPEVQATVTWQLLTFADRHQQQARRLRAQANDVLANVEDLRATLGRLIARADVIWQVEARWRTAEQRDQLDYLSAQMLRLEAEIAQWRARIIALRQDAKLEEARAIVCRRAAASSDRY